MLIHLNDDPSFFNLLDQCIVAALMILPYLLSNSCYKLDTITTTRRLYDSDDETETGESNRKRKRTTRMKDFEDAKSQLYRQGADWSNNAKSYETGLS